jgi:hypothetical protein
MKVKISNILGKDFYPDLENPEVQIYDVDYRHWDTWNEEFHTTSFTKKHRDAVGTDIMGKENFDSPQSLLAEMKIIWSPTVKKFFVNKKKKAGTQYAISTNTN